MNVTTIKNDLVDLVTKEKYYLEQDFIRLVDSKEKSYELVIREISEILDKIALANTKLELINQYIQPIDNVKKKQMFKFLFILATIYVSYILMILSYKLFLFFRLNQEDVTFTLKTEELIGLWLSLAIMLDYIF